MEEHALGYKENGEVASGSGVQSGMKISVCVGGVGVVIFTIREVTVFPVQELWLCSPSPHKTHSLHKLHTYPLIISKDGISSK